MKQGYKYSWTEMGILKQNWNKIAEEYKGKYKTIGAQSFGNLSDPVLRKFELKIPFSGGQIVLLTTELKPLKIRFEFRDEAGNEFLIYPEDFTDKTGKLFGLKELEIGDSEFDRKFFIKGDNKKFIKQILTPDLKKYLIDNYVANFKLERVKGLKSVELNIVINELKYSEMVLLIKLFQKCIMTIKG